MHIACRLSTTEPLRTLNESTRRPNSHRSSKKAPPPPPHSGENTLDGLAGSGVVTLLQMTPIRSTYFPDAPRRPMTPWFAGQVKTGFWLAPPLPPNVTAPVVSPA